MPELASTIYHGSIFMIVIETAHLRYLYVIDSLLYKGQPGLLTHSIEDALNY